MKYIVLLLICVMLASCGSSGSLKVLEAKDEYGFAITGQTLHLFKDKANTTEKQLGGRRYQREFDRIKSFCTPGREDVIPECVFTEALIKGTDTLYAASTYNYWKYNGRIAIYKSDVFKAALTTALPDSILANYDVLD
jgi:hypothetical protein